MGRSQLEFVELRYAGLANLYLIASTPIYLGFFFLCKPRNRETGA